MKSSGTVFQERPYNGEVEPTTFEDMSRRGNDGTLANITMTRLPSGLWYPVYNGTNSKITVGNIAKLCNAFACWINPDNHTRSIVDFDSGTHSVEITAGTVITATGWTSPTIYVNASSASAAVELLAWKFVVVTSATAFTVSGLVLGDEASWYDGGMGLVKLLDRVPSAEEIDAIFQSERHWFGV